MADLSIQEGEVATVHHDEPIAAAGVTDASVCSLAVASEFDLVVTGMKPGEADLVVRFASTGSHPQTDLVRVYSRNLPSERVLQRLVASVSSAIGADYLRDFALT